MTGQQSVAKPTPLTQSISAPKGSEPSIIKPSHPPATKVSQQPAAKGSSPSLTSALDSNVSVVFTKVGQGSALNTTPIQTALAKTSTAKTGATPVSTNSQRTMASKVSKQLSTTKSAQVNPSPVPLLKQIQTLPAQTNCVPATQPNAKRPSSGKARTAAVVKGTQVRAPLMEPTQALSALIKLSQATKSKASSLSSGKVSTAAVLKGTQATLLKATASSRPTTGKTSPSPVPRLPSIAAGKAADSAVKAHKKPPYCTSSQSSSVASSPRLSPTPAASPSSSDGVGVTGIVGGASGSDSVRQHRRGSCVKVRYSEHPYLRSTSYWYSLAGICKLIVLVCLSVCTCRYCLATKQLGTSSVS